MRTYALLDHHGLAQRVLDGCLRRHVHVDVEQSDWVEGEELEFHHAQRQRTAGGDEQEEREEQIKNGTAHHVDKRAGVSSANVVRPAFANLLGAAL